MLNRGSKAIEISVSTIDLGLAPAARVRDLWLKKDVGRLGERLRTTVRPHSVAMLKISAS
ncbi:MAG: hypothetical protein E6K49_06795 [Gammaproteobacteria bacterium]|nr:MAG: hypothetical protein E6K49_06795 [Gammaproteobacteria bacterium]